MDLLCLTTINIRYRKNHKDNLESQIKRTLAPWPALHHVKPKLVQGFNSFKNREMKDQRMILRGKKYLRSRLSSLFMSTLRLLRMLTPLFFQIRRE